MGHIETAHPYFGVFVFFVLTFGAFFATLTLTRFISHKLARRDTEKLKLSIYECGTKPIKQPNKISTQFFMFALLFILFDVEIIFMFPWAVDFRILGWFGFIEMMTFIFLLLFGFIYAWKKGALEWRSIK